MSVPQAELRGPQLITSSEAIKPGASPESGKCSIDAYVFNELMRDLVGRHRKPSAFLVYVTLSIAADGRQVPCSHGRLALQTGLSKRSVQEAIRLLIDRELVRAVKTGVTDTIRYEVMTPWRRTVDRAALEVSGA